MDAFDLFAKITLDSSEYDRGLDRAEQKASSFGSKTASLLGGGLKTAATVGVAAIGAATTAVGALTKASVDGYAEFEQLRGGVQKLYGNMGQSLEEYTKAAVESGQPIEEAKQQWASLETAQNAVMENAKNAYATVGISANEYMDQAMSFSAALINSLGGDTVKAAEQADVAMRAMADNVNTFGTDMASVQYSFQGFAKQNYTMLDNLKLGYGGTKEEMARLIQDANAYAEANGKAADLTMSSFSDIVTAIELIQEKQNIAGTTAREAATTVQGSLSMLGAAWNNLVAGFANPDADIGQLIDNVISSAEIAFGNLLPVAQRAIEGISQSITEGLPEALNSLSAFIEETAPAIVSAATDIVMQVAQELPNVAASIVNTIPGIMNQIADAIGSNVSVFTEKGTDIATNISTGLSNGLTNITDVATQMIDSLTTGISDNLPNLLDQGLYIAEDFSGSLRENAGKLVDSGIELIKSIADGLISGIPTMIETIPTIISNIAGIINDNAPKLLAAGVEIIVKLAAGIVKAIPTLIENIPKILKAIWDAFMAFNWINLGTKVINFIKDGLMSAVKNIPNALKSIFETAKNTVNTIKFGEAGTKIIDLILNGMSHLIAAIPQTLGEIAQTAINVFTSVNWLDVGIQVITAIVNGLSSMLDAIGSVAMNIGAKIWEVITTTDWVQVGVTVLTAIANGISTMIELVGTAAVAIGTVIWDKVTSVDWIGLGGEILNAIANGITSLLSIVANAAAQIGESIKNKLTEIANQAIQWGSHIIDNLVSGIRNGIGKVAGAVTAVAGKIKDIIGFSEPKEGPLSDFHTYAPDMIDLFASGITSNTGKVVTAITGTASALSKNLKKGLKNATAEVKSFTKTAEKLLGDRSISKAAEKQGAALAQGVIDGIDAQKKEAAESAEEFGELVLESAKNRLEEDKKYHEWSLEAEAAYWNAVRQQTAEGSNARLAIEQQYNEALENSQKESQEKSLSRFLTNVNKTVVGAKSAANQLMAIMGTNNTETLRSAEQWLNNYKVYHDVSLKYEVDYWNHVRKMAVKGTQERIELDRKYFETKKAMIQALKRMESESYDDSDDDFEDYSSDYTSAVEDFGNNVVDTVNTYEEDALAAQEEAHKKAIDEYVASAGLMLKTTKKAVAGLAKVVGKDRTDLLSYAEKWLSNREVYYGESLKYAAVYWKRVSRLFKTGTQERIDADKKYFDAYNEYLEDQKKKDEEALETRVNNYVVNVNKIVKSAAVAAKTLINTTTKAYKDMISAAEEWLENYKVYHDVSVGYEVAYWQKIRKQYTQGTKERLEADKIYFDALESYQQERADKYATGVSKVVTNFTKAAKNVSNFAKKTTGNAMELAEQWLENYRVYHNVALDEEMKYWDQVRKAYKTGTQERIEADKRYYEARAELSHAKTETKAEAREIVQTYLAEYNKIVESRDTAIKQIQLKLQQDIDETNNQMVKDLADAEAELEKNITSVNEKLTSDINSLTEAYKNNVDSRINSIMGMTALFDRVSYDRTYSKEYLMDALTEQVGALEEWDKELDALQKKLGRDNPLLKSLQEMGVSSLYTLQEVNSMSEEELQAYSDMYAKKSQVATERAVQESEGLLEATNQQIALLRQQAQAEINEYERIAQESWNTILREAEETRATLRREAEANIKELMNEASTKIKELNAQYKTDLKNLAKDVKNSGKDVGKALCDGIVAGINASKSVLTNASKKVSNDLLKTVKSTLGIKSPSKEFAWVGKMVDEGFAQGILKNSKMVSDEIEKIINIPNKIPVNTFSVDSQATQKTGGDFVQNLTVNAPQALSPSEVARQTRLANQQMVLALRGI